MDIGAREIDKWHRAKGWLKIGYHFVIRRNGMVETGRDLMEPGAHARGYNHKSVGVCLVGGDEIMTNDDYTPEQWLALGLLLSKLKGQFPGARIIGHNEIAAKACPSFDVQAWLKANPL